MHRMEFHGDDEGSVPHLSLRKISSFFSFDLLIVVLVVVVIIIVVVLFSFFFLFLLRSSSSFYFLSYSISWICIHVRMLLIFKWFLLYRNDLFSLLFHFLSKWIRTDTDTYMYIYTYTNCRKRNDLNLFLFDNFQIYY